MSDEGHGNDGIIALLAGLGVGMLIGATTALLLAPRPGHETRAQVKETLDGSVNRIRNSLEQTRAKVDELIASRRPSTEASHAGDVAGVTEESAETG